MVLCLLVSGIGTLLTPLAHGASLISAILLIGNQVITDPAATIYNINEVTLRQTIVPNQVLGRVGATLRFAGLGMALVGAFIGGVVGETFGLRIALVIGTSVTFIAAGFLACSPVMQLRGEATTDGSAI